MARQDKSPEGKWCENAANLLPSGPLEWIDGKGGLMRTVAVINGKAVASARKVHGGYSVGIEGWQWKVTPDMAANRFNSIPGDKITYSSYKFFPRIISAKKEVERIFATLANSAVKQSVI